MRYLEGFYCNNKKGLGEASFLTNYQVCRSSKFESPKGGNNVTNCNQSNRSKCCPNLTQIGNLIFERVPGDTPKVAKSKVNPRWILRNLEFSGPFDAGDFTQKCHSKMNSVSLILKMIGLYTYNRLQIKDCRLENKEWRLQSKDF